MPTRPPARRLPFGVLLLALLVAFSFGAIVRTAFAVDYHTTCVGHGFVSGSDPTDGSFFSRVEIGCSSTYRTCDIYTGGVWQGGQATPNANTTCNAWSRDYGSLSECNSTAHVYDQGVFSAHVHTPNNYCG